MRSFQYLHKCQKILIAFEGLLFLRLVFHGGITVWYLTMGRDQYFANLNILSLQFDGLYFADRMSLIFLYSFLQQMKFAQMTINAANTSTNQVMRNLWLYRIFSVIIILINICAFVTLIASREFH